MKTGIELIAEERQRQIDIEGWTSEHDAEHTDNSLLAAAVAYATNVLHPIVPEMYWPSSWEISWWKPKDPITDLKRAGALIAAEIDRLQQLKENDCGYKTEALPVLRE